MKRGKTETVMKKRLNLFCVLIFVVIVCDLLSMSNTFVAGFTAGMKHGTERRPVTETSPANCCYISLLPVEMTRENAVTVADKGADKRYEVWPT